MKIIFSPKKPKNKNLANVVISKKKEVEVQRVAGRKQIVVGVGEKVNLRKLRLLLRQIVSLAKGNGITGFSVSFQDLRFNIPISEGELAEVIASEFEIANYEFNKYKTPPKGGFKTVEQIVIVGKVSAQVKKASARGKLIGEEVNATRALSNTPGGEMTPNLLAKAAKGAAAGTGVRVSILGVADMKDLGMGGILGVAAGSREEPRFIILEYWGGDKKEAPVVLVGKGVTFDTGGLNLKPSEHIYEMHMDMSGGAAVIHSVILAAKLGLKKNIVGLVPAAENMPSGSSYRPGDILRTMSGQTIEVLNTDAEGRIILADALAYAKEYKPRLVVDVATLTGAMAVALGQRASGVFSPDDKLRELFVNLGEESGDYVWPFPLLGN